MSLKLPRLIVVCCLQHKHDSSKDVQVIENNTGLKLAAGGIRLGPLRGI
jgi:hypothetical protein